MDAAMGLNTGTHPFLPCDPDGVRVHQREFGALGLGPLSLHPAQPLSLHASRNSGTDHHDESKSARCQGPRPQRVRAGLRQLTP